MKEYVAASRDDASFQTYLAGHVFEVESEDEYIERFVRCAARQPEPAT
jgi:hypothetical protein